MTQTPENASCDPSPTRVLLSKIAGDNAALHAELAAISISTDIPKLRVMAIYAPVFIARLAALERLTEIRLCEFSEARQRHPTHPQQRNTMEIK